MNWQTCIISNWLSLLEAKVTALLPAESGRRISFRTFPLCLLMTVAHPRQLKNMCPKARKHQWQRKRNLQHFACAATSEEGPQVSFGTIEILLPGVDLFQDLATEKANLQGFVSFTFEVHYRQRTGTSIPNFAFYSKTLNRYIEILCNTVSVFFDSSVCHHTQHISHWSNLAFICLF